MDLSIQHLCLMRCMLKKGICISLIRHFLTRCNIELNDWERMIEEGLVKQRKDLRDPAPRTPRWCLTEEGLKSYRIQSTGRYF
jgi:hypothetical protein